MLKGINPLLTGDLLRVLSDMGHADEIVIGDGNFASTGDSMRRPPIWVACTDTVQVVEAILSVFPLDEGKGSYGVIVEEDWGRELPEGPRQVRRSFMEVMAANAGNPKADALDQIPRMKFHERARQAYAVVATIDPRHYACFTLRKGALPDPTV